MTKDFSNTQQSLSSKVTNSDTNRPQEATMHQHPLRLCELKSQTLSLDFGVGDLKIHKPWAPEMKRTYLLLCVVL